MRFLRGQLGRAVVDPRYERLVELAGRLEDLRRGGEKRAALVARVRLAPDVPGALEPVRERGDAAGREEQEIAELARRQPAVPREVRKGSSFRLVEAEAAGDTRSMTRRGERLAMEQIAKPLGWERIGRVFTQRILSDRRIWWYLAQQERFVAGYTFVRRRAPAYLPID
jgi:hypothetical protein